jgi:prefoldin subunit 5
MKEIQGSDSLNMISICENDLKSVQDILRSILESNHSLRRTMLESNQNIERKLDETNKKISENNQNMENKFSEMNQNISEMTQNLQETMSETKADNQNFLKRLDKFHLNIENEIDYAVESKLGQNIEDITAVMDKISSKQEELNEKCEKLADDMDGEVNNVIPKVQVEDEDCTEENLKRQGEKAAQLYVNSNDIPSELSEEIDWSPIIENTWVPDKSRSICISTTQANYEVTSKITRKRTSDYKCICLFRKYACTFRTVRKYATLYERDRVINNDIVKRYKKCKRLEWCINVKKRKMLVHIGEKEICNSIKIFKYVIIVM